MVKAAKYHIKIGKGDKVKYKSVRKDAEGHYFYMVNGKKHFPKKRKVQKGAKPKMGKKSKRKSRGRPRKSKSKRKSRGRPRKSKGKSKRKSRGRPRKSKGGKKAAVKKLSALVKKLKAAM